MRWKLACATGILLLASHGAYAQFSSTVTLASEYDFRGVSQSAKDPALQASADYGFGNGFAVGVWGSNVDFGPVDGDLEIDYYGSYTGTISDTASWTGGAVWYSYPSSNDIGEYVEIYAGINIGPFSGKQWYADDLYDLGENAWYTEGSATFELPQDFSLLLHLGYSWGDAWDLDGGEIFDYSVGVGYEIQNFALSLKLTGTDASGLQKNRGDVENNEDRLLFSVATTLPWGK